MTGDTMTKEEIALALNGLEYKQFQQRLKELELKQNGLVVVYGASDDLMELDGAIYDEFGCYGGGVAYLNEDGELLYPCENPCPHCDLESAMDAAREIEAVWNEEGYSWTYRTFIPHATFDVLEDDH